MEIIIIWAIIFATTTAVIEAEKPVPVCEHVQPSDRIK